MKLLTTFFLLSTLSSGICRAQEINALVSDLKKAFPSLEKVSQVIKEHRRSNALDYSTLYNRVNFFELNHKQQIITKFKSDSNDGLKKRWLLRENGDTSWSFSRFRENEWDIDIYSSSGTVIFMNLQEYTRNEKWADDTLLFYIDTVWAKSYIGEFNVRMKTSFSFSKCFEDSQYDYYGISWGLSLFSERQVQEPMKNVYRLVKQKNIELIRRLCLSECLETKAYGATGLFLLQKEGFVLERKEEQLLQKLRKSKERIQFGLGGCLIEPASFATALSNEFLEEVSSYYERYKKEN